MSIFLKRLLLVSLVGVMVTGNFGINNAWAIVPLVPGLPVLTNPPATGGPVFQTAPLTTLDPIAEAQRTAVETKKEIDRSVLGTLALTVTSALHNAVYYFTQKLAYDSAVWLASSGEGQLPLLEIFKGGEYRTRLLKEAAGHAIGKASEDTGLGNLLCAPAINIKLMIALPGIRALYLPPTPACDFKNVIENWKKFGQSISNGEILRNFGIQFDPNKSELGYYLTVSDHVIAKSEENQLAGALDWMRGTFKPLTDAVTKRVKSPAEIIKERTEASLKKGDSVDDKQLAGAYLQGMLYPEFFLGPASVFANTLASQLTQKWLGAGFLSLADLAGIDEDLIPEVPRPGEEAIPGGGESTGGRARAELAYLDLLTPRIIRDQVVDVLAEYASCPPPRARGPNNCLMDQGMAAAIRRADTGNPMTVRDALAATLLHENWVLASPGPPNQESVYRSGGSPCYEHGERQAYCYTDLVKLRKARILPIGWEMAARANTSELKLGAIVDAFDDAASPFYRLIDPNWLLRIPAAQCHMRAFTDSLDQPDTGRRAEQCVDLRSCLEEDNQGNCIGGFGYCMREKNTWRFPMTANSCPQQFESCRTLTRAGDNKTVSYLLSSADVGSCTKDVAGCRWYELGGEGGPKRYFRRTIARCPQTAAGCSEFAPVLTAPLADGFSLPTLADVPTNSRTTAYDTTQTPRAYIKIAPDALGCYDSNSNRADGTQWPLNVGEAVTVARSASSACGAYAPVCAPTEANCESYENRATNETIYAVLGAGDRCPEQCVGYRTWLQSSTYFESVPPVIKTVPPYPAPGAPGEADFIASRARSCPTTAVGCDEFTNLDKLASGGEAREYYTYLRSCIKPGAAGDTTFYTWEGSDTTGFQLKAWRLAANADGSPRLSSTGGDITQACNATVAKMKPVNADGSRNDEYFSRNASDCREFLDATGRTYYARWSRTVVVTADCHPYRKSTNISVPTIATEAQCRSSGGTWEQRNGVGTCVTIGERNCLAWGGDWKDSACFIDATPGSDSRSCTAAQVGCRQWRASVTSQRLMFFDTFENVTPDWSAAHASVSSVSELPGGHSLRIRNLATRQLTGLVTGRTYRLTFLEENTTGVGTNSFAVSLGGRPLQGESSMSGIAGWRTYEYTGVYDGTTASAPLAFRFEPDPDPSDTAALYIDNVMLVEEETDSVVTVIRGSWSTPRSCDTGSDGSQQMGAQLRCAAYKTRKENTRDRQPVTAKSFANICRADAVGCRAFIDTRNSQSKDAQTFNTANTDASDDVHVPADRLVWVVPTIQTQCLAEQRGCMLYSYPSQITWGSTTATCNLGTRCAAGAPGWNGRNACTCTLPAPDGRECIVTSGFPDCIVPGVPTAQIIRDAVVVQDLPDAYDVPPAGTGAIQLRGANYGPLLCEARFAGCEAFKEKTNNTSTSDAPQEVVFMDPEFTGNVCTYDEVKGWVRKGTDDPCHQPTALNARDPVSVLPKRIPTAVDGGGTAPAYEGLTGECSAKHNRCTAFIDPIDTVGDGSARAKAYYYIDDDNLGGGTCDGKVDLNHGCVLFNDTSVQAATDTSLPGRRPSNLFNVPVTYSRWEDLIRADGESHSVAPVDCRPQKSNGSPATTLAEVAQPNPCNLPAPPALGEGNDANRLMAVTRSRSCGQWLSCMSSQRRRDQQNNNEVVEICSQYGICRGWEETPNGPRCGSWYPLDNRRNLAVNGSFELRTSSASLPDGWSNLDTSYLDASQTGDAPRDGAATVTVTTKSPVIPAPNTFWTKRGLQSTNPLQSINNRTFTVSVWYKNNASTAVRDTTCKAWLFIARNGGAAREASGGAVQDVSDSWALLRDPITFGSDPAATASVFFGVVRQNADGIESADPGGCSVTFDALQIEEGNQVSNYGISVLNTSRYTSRPVLWSEMAHEGGDYTGYSIPNQVSAAQLREVNTAAAGADQASYHLAFVDGACSAVPGGVCGTDGQGRCYRGLCAYGLDGGVLDVAKSARSCRAFPRADSPFPYSAVVASETADGAPVFKQDYENVHVCHRKLGQTEEMCECTYQTGDYSVGKKLFFDMQVAPPAGVCRENVRIDCNPQDYFHEVSAGATMPDGSRAEHAGIGEHLASANDFNAKVGDIRCPGSHQCNALKSVQENRGMFGYCLEEDLRRKVNGGKRNACLTWLPVDVTAGDLDLYAAPKAEFNFEAASGGRHQPWYCADSQNRAILISDTYITRADVQSDQPFIVEHEIEAGRELFRDNGAYFRVVRDPNPGTVREHDLFAGTYSGQGSIENQVKVASSASYLMENVTWDDVDRFIVATDDSVIVMDGTRDRILMSNDQFKLKVFHDASSTTFELFKRTNDFSFAITRSSLFSVLTIRYVALVLKPRAVCNQFAYLYERDEANPAQRSSKPLVVATNRLNNLGIDFVGVPIGENTLSTQCVPWGNVSETLVHTPRGDSYPMLPVLQNQINDACRPFYGGLYMTRFAPLSSLIPKVGSATPKIRLSQYDGSADDCPFGFSSATGGGPCPGYDVTGVGTNGGVHSPHIAAPDGSRCDTRTQTCPIVTSGLDTFAMKATSSTEGYGISNVLQGRGHLEVKLGFYAWADHDHMPLRNMVVDFGDGSPRVNEGVTSSFKNYKPYCSAEGQPARSCADDNNITCSVNTQCSLIGKGLCDRTNENFGNTHEVCEAGLTEFTHVYVWKDGYPCDGRDGSINDDNRPANERAACYRAKVIVRDNWGWCNSHNARGRNDAIGVHDSASTDNNCLNNSSAGNISEKWITVHKQ